MSIAQPTQIGTRPYVRALATSQGHHMAGIGASIEGSEQLAMQEQHDAVSDAYHKRADDELDIAQELRDYRLIHAHIRASKGFREEAYRHEALEDDRRDLARASLDEARDAGLAGSDACERVLSLRLLRKSEAPDAA